MIKEVDEAILETLKEGLHELMPPENILIGDPEGEKTKAVFLINADFIVEEMGIGGSVEVKNEEVFDKFNSDGAQREFHLSKKPLRPLISVDAPLGISKHEPDDYTVDYDRGIISFRQPPTKDKKIQTRYNIPHAVSETHNLKFVLDYIIKVCAPDRSDRDKITLEIIKILYRERSELEKKGISKIRLVKGISRRKDEDTKKACILQYLVETTLPIEMQIPAIERIEIKGK
jgi:hypothetical protein